MRGYTTKIKDNIVTVRAEINGVLDRNVKIEIGKEYICKPHNKLKKLHRDRRFIVIGFEETNYGIRAKVKFSDTKRHGLVEVDDIDYILEDLTI